MKALVYLGPAKKAVEERPKPEITAGMFHKSIE
jgi:hypothetical protein